MAFRLIEFWQVRPWDLTKFTWCIVTKSGVPTHTSWLIETSVQVIRVCVCFFRESSWSKAIPERFGFWFNYHSDVSMRASIAWPYTERERDGRELALQMTCQQSITRATKASTYIPINSSIFGRWRSSSPPAGRIHFPVQLVRERKKKKEATLPRLPHRKTLGLLALGKKAYDSTDRPFSLRTTVAARVERVLVLRRKCFVPVQSSVPVIRLIRKSPLETMRIIYLLGLVIGVTFVSAKHHLWPDVNPATMSPSIRDESDVQSDDGQSNIASGGYLKNRSRIDTSSQSSKVPSPNINQTSAAEMEAIGSIQKNMSHSTRSNQDHHHRNKHWPVAKGIQQPGRPSTGWVQFHCWCHLHL